ncbi:hypothetical protein KJ359_004664 [Pestalotiopsis sp. 9143b]|nr:hypothetical protein KJ359_004664 [Pestalotiopsis sp. 9143b]
MPAAQSRTLWAVAVAAAPLLYVLYTKAAYNASTTVTFTTGRDARRLDGEDILPADVFNDQDGEWVVVRERVVSAPFTPRILEADDGHVHGEKTAETDSSSSSPSLLLDTYLRTTMRMFTRTPQALLMRRMLSGPPRHTFDAAYLSACAFAPGDRVCGVYVVSSRTASRAVLTLAPPTEGWSGPVVRGRLVAAVEGGDGGGMVRTVNETVLWRRRHGEAPVFLEGWVGRWVHGFMVQWMMVGGARALREGRARSE